MPHQDIDPDFALLNAQQQVALVGKHILEFVIAQGGKATSNEINGVLWEKRFINRRYKYFQIYDDSLAALMSRGELVRIREGHYRLPCREEPVPERPTTTRWTFTRPEAIAFTRIFDSMKGVEMAEHRIVEPAAKILDAFYGDALAAARFVGRLSEMRILIFLFMPTKAEQCELGAGTYRIVESAMLATIDRMVLDEQDPIADEIAHIDRKLAAKHVTFVALNAEEADLRRRYAEARAELRTLETLKQDLVRVESLIVKRPAT